MGRHRGAGFCEISRFTKWSRDSSWRPEFCRTLTVRVHGKAGRSMTWIRDKQVPSRQLWIMIPMFSCSAIMEDHAIARLLESATGQPIVIAGGHIA